MLALILSPRTVPNLSVYGPDYHLFYNRGIRNLILDHMLPKSLILVCRTASVIGDKGCPTVCTFWGFLFLFGQFLCE